MKVAVYFRFSSDKFDQVENSEKRQKQNVQKFCQVDNSWSIEWCDGDEKTSGDKHKPKLMELKHLIISGELAVDYLVIDEWNRLTRKDSLEFQEDV